MTSAELSATKYASRRRELLSLVNQLRALGAQGDLDLPRITVIGKQSAGKSSVVEAISGITVPRDAGTCTRCPMEIRMKCSPGPWSCRVSIRLEFDSSGNAIDDVSEIQFFETTEKVQVETMLRLAQLAVLNPVVVDSDDPLREFMATEHANPVGALLFSRNVVCVDIKGPDLTDLSFVDLPGLVQNADPSDVELIEDLVTSSIKGNCLILVALPVSDEIENQKALRLAQQADPEGRRTIGVLTKPDTLPPGSINARKFWADVLDGHIHRLKHGYYCTRQPDDDQRTQGITSTQARVEEAEFFAQVKPWSKCRDRRRLGTKNLVGTLSTLLVRVINESLPQIIKDATERLEATKKELADLPPTIDEPGTYLQTLITRLNEDFQNYVRGGSEFSQLMHENRSAYLKFKKAIEATRPKFIAVPDKTTIDGDSGSQSLFDLSDMRKHIDRSVTRELKGNVPYQAKVSVIQVSQTAWKDSVIECFTCVQVSLVKVLLSCVDEIYEHHARVRLQLISYLEELVREHFNKCFEFLEADLQSEATPFTQNNHYLDCSTAKWFSRYKEERAKNLNTTPDGGVLAALGLHNLREQPQEKINGALAALAALGCPGLTVDDLGKLNPPDEYETELKVMAEVQGYWKVSYKRVIDKIPSLIDLKFVRAVGTALQPFLLEKFELGTIKGNERCAMYLAEDPDLIEFRKDLEGKKQRLEKVQLELGKFGF